VRIGGTGIERARSLTAFVFSRKKKQEGKKSRSRSSSKFWIILEKSELNITYFGFPSVIY